MVQNSSKRHVVLASLLLVGVTLVFLILGAAGPKSTQATLNSMHMCVTPLGSEHIWNTETTLIDKEECPKLGRQLKRDDEEQKKLKYYPIQNIVFFAVIPHLDNHVMSRDFEFMMADLSIQFFSSSYVKEFVDQGDSTLKFEVALGYRDATQGPWKRMVTGNVTRTLSCGYHKELKGLYNCATVPLFELGSCHHKQYIINLVFPSLPLHHNPEYRGLAQLDRLGFFEIHQSQQFTMLWLYIKSFLFPVTSIAVLWFWKRLFVVTRGRRVSGEAAASSLIERFLGFLGGCLVFYNAPFRYLSLYYDCPWLLVLEDFQQGIFIAALFSFWIIFVSEHNPNKAINSHIGRYWKQMGVISVASIFFFVYEFCERGIQVILPFYSLWSGTFGIITAWVFISVASTSAFIYLILLVVKLFQVLRDLRLKQKELQALSSGAQQNINLPSLFSSLRFFLVITFVVAACTILTVVLPSEIMIHYWQHSSTDYNYYSGILTGNYGMWNAYCIVMLYLYAPSVTKTTDKTTPLPGGEETQFEDPAFRNLLTKSAQN